MESGSKIFTSYRGLGLVSNDIPLEIRYIKRRKENFVVTVVGNAFHTYEAKHLRLIGVGNPQSSKITCMAADTYHIYTASKQTIYAWRRTNELVHTYLNHADNVTKIMAFGPHIISVDRSNTIYIWDIKSEELYLQMEFPESFLITSLMHPATYLNKILLGSKRGKLQLWNVKTSKLIFTFTGWDSEVTILEQAPAQDVVAIGLHNGDIHLHNLKFDETVVSFKQEWGPVISLSFRTDGPTVMVSGSLLGHIAIWDLQDRRLSSQIWEAHSQGVTGMKCLPNEPKMITSSPDNSMKMWIFDMPDGGARLLASREGLSAPPLMTRFHGNLGDSILAAGEDSTLRVFSTVTDVLHKSLGEAVYNRKALLNNKNTCQKLTMAPIVAFTSDSVHDKPWDNIACIHRNQAVATTWSFTQQKMGDHKLKHKRFKNPEWRGSIATCLTLSVCGNFIIIGYDSGHLDKFNIQSGLFRGSFIDSHGLAHRETICSVVSDGLNQIVASGDIKGTLKMWRFKTRLKFCQLKLDSGVSGLHLHRDSGLLAIVLEDWSLQIADIDTRKVIRQLDGHTNQITDVAFSPDSKWLISSSLDRSIRTWDLPSSTCVDAFCVPVAASAVAMSPIGEFIATVHAGHLGVYLWANRTCFQHVSLHPLPEDFTPPLLQLPSVGVDEGRMPLKEGEEEQPEEEQMDIDEEKYESPEQLSVELVTLALLPTSRWLNLLHIDTIKSRNKPIAPPTIPKSAPFFIPTVPGLNFQFGEEKDQEGKDKGHSKLKSISSFEKLTPFGEKLDKRLYNEALEMLMGYGPAAIDVEIRALDPIMGGSEEIMLNFLRMIKRCISKRKHFEVVQGYLGLYLKVHADFVTENEEAQEICQKLLNAHTESWHTIKNHLDQSLSLISYFKNAAILNY